MNDSLVKYLKENSIQSKYFWRIVKKNDALRKQRDSLNGDIVKQIRKIATSTGKVRLKEIKKLIDIRCHINFVSYKLDISHSELIKVNQNHCNAMIQVLSQSKEFINLSRYKEITDKYRGNFTKSFIKKIGGLDRANEIAIYEYLIKQAKTRRTK